MRVLSRVLDLCDTVEEHSNQQQHNQESGRLEHAMAQVRQELQDLQTAMQQQQAVLIHCDFLFAVSPTCFQPNRAPRDGARASLNDHGTHETWVCLSSGTPSSHNRVRLEH